MLERFREAAPGPVPRLRHGHDRRRRTVAPAGSLLTAATCAEIGTEGGGSGGQSADRAAEKWAAVPADSLQSERQKSRQISADSLQIERVNNYTEFRRIVCRLKGRQLCGNSADSLQIRPRDAGLNENKSNW